MTVRVVRVELSREQFEQISERAHEGAHGSMGAVVCESLREALPVLGVMTDAPFAQGSRVGIQIPAPAPSAGLQAGLPALRRIAQHTPPPMRFTHPIQLAIPSELYDEVERERARLGLTLDALIAWAWRRR